MKLVINSMFGGFSLSEKAIELYKKYIKQQDPNFVFSDNFFSEDEEEIGDKIPRYDPCLIRVLEELGDEANGASSHLTIVQIEDGCEWMIEAYDGYEWVSQAHKIYSDYPMSPPKIISGKGMMSQEIYYPPTIYKNDNNAALFNECRTQ
jgi:hypothetical protein